MRKKVIRVQWKFKSTLWFMSMSVKKQGHWSDQAGATIWESKTRVAQWSSGMIPASGAGGPGFKSRLSPNIFSLQNADGTVKWQVIGPGFMPCKFLSIPIISPKYFTILLKATLSIPLIIIWCLKLHLFCVLSLFVCSACLFLCWQMNIIVSKALFCNESFIVL